MPLFTLAKVLKNAGRICEARETAERAYEMSKRYYGEYHTETMQIKEMLDKV